jgi:hypothetical protein
VIIGRPYGAGTCWPWVLYVTRRKLVEAGFILWRYDQAPNNPNHRGSITVNRVKPYSSGF